MSVELINIDVSFNSKVILDHLNLHFDNNKVTCLFGISGCGKTTILNLIANLIEPHNGKVCGTQGLKTAYVFQDDRLIPNISILENILAVCKNKESQVEKAKGLLSEMGLSSDYNKKPFEMSGGMNKRVNIARAIMYNADILLLDEPFAALDDTTKSNIMDIIKRECKDKIIALVTHSKDEALKMSDKIYVLSEQPVKVKGEIQIDLPYENRLEQVNELQKYYTQLIDITRCE